MRKKIWLLIVFIPLLLVACDKVHEWPDTPEYVKLHLRLNYDTDMTEWEHEYKDKNVNELGYGDVYDNNRYRAGVIKYIVRTYSSSDNQVAPEYTQEFVFTKDVTDGFDHEVTLNMLPGNYKVMVWSDLMSVNRSDGQFYDATDFAEIKLQGVHEGNNNYRDAFRGSENVTLVANTMERLPDTLDIAMQRPLAKFELITDDIVDFIQKESNRIASENGVESCDDTSQKTVNMEDYRLVFYYVGFMPNTYSMYTDTPVDASTGVVFESTLKRLSNTETSIGFDYVFMRDNRSYITVQLGLYSNDGEVTIISSPINIPLKRSHHTKIFGSFLTDDSSNGTLINPGYNGDHNLIFP